MKKVMFHKVARAASFSLIFAISLGLALFSPRASAQDEKSAPPKGTEPAATSKDSSTPARTAAQAYSGMYTFREEGEFVQVTVEDDGRVTGFISRFGDGDSDKGAFLDQFFKSAKLEGNKLSFTTEVVHGVSFDFKGTVARGDGKNPGDENYFVLQGALVEHKSDANKKVTTRSSEVAFKMFPQEASVEPGAK
jgi:hypothetical protein